LEKNAQEWVTQESFFGELVDGILLETSIDYCKSLIESSQPFVLKELQEITSFEIAIGVNGR